MIGGIAMILTTVWIYQTLIKGKIGNLLWWVVGCAALFFAVEFLVEILCIEMIDALGGKDIGGEYDPSLTDARDRKTQEGPGGLIMPFLCELLPIFAGFLAVAVVRTQFILKREFDTCKSF